MPRPLKCRKVCHFPNVLEFLPADGTEKSTPIVLTVDEYETIRLLDKKGLKLSDRIYRCDCGYVEDRDFNAALNLRDAFTYEVA